MISPETPLIPRKDTGPLKRRRVYELLQQFAPRLGFSLSADDISGVRSTGEGLHIRRKLHVPPATITLYLDLEYRWAIATYCTGLLDSGSAYTTLTQTANFQFGVKTYTTIQPDPGPHIQNISGGGSFSCPGTETTDDVVPGKNYGSSLGTGTTTYSGLLDPAALLSAAGGALVHDASGDYTVSRTWTQRGTRPTDITATLGRFTGTGAGSRRIDRYRYRWRVGGPIKLRVDWTQGGGAQYDVIAGGGTSSWYDDTLPATAGVNDTISAVTIVEIEE